MKVLSLWQPWASLIARGYKQFETRSWSTSYRGLLVIHAAKHFTIEEREICMRQPFAKALKQAGYNKLADLPLGAALCVVELVDILPTERVRSEGYKAHRFIDELAYGNYADGRYAWKLKYHMRFASPVPMRGAQGLFDIPQELREQIQIFQ